MINRPRKTRTSLKRQTLLISLLLMTAMGWTELVRGEPQHDLLFFLSLEAIGTFSSSNPALEESDGRATADILYTYNNDNFRVLGEYIWSDTENELERLKAGWRFNDQTVLWLGRFHSISKLWTTEFHHGQFLQTSISRPGLEEWEDESGPMPSHNTGLFLEHVYAGPDQHAMTFGLAAGLAPKFAGQELVPFDLLDPESGHKLAVNYRMTYRPDILSVNQVGLALAWNDISVVSESNPDLADLRAIRQMTVGVFADWHWTDWRLLANWVYFDNELQSVGADVKDKFSSAYAQGEYKAAEDWTIFGRSEFSFNDDRSPYLRLLPAFIAHRNMLGVRWDFTDNQSLTVEAADTGTQGGGSMHDHFNELRIQWSAVFP